MVDPERTAAVQIVPEAAAAATAAATTATAAAATATKDDGNLLRRRPSGGEETTTAAATATATAAAASAATGTATAASARGTAGTAAATMSPRKMSPDGEVAIRLRRAHKHYGGGARARPRVPVLVGLDMTIPRGAIYGLLGPSGCGKTTLLQCIVGKQRLVSGAVEVGASHTQKNRTIIIHANLLLFLYLEKGVHRCIQCGLPIFLTRFPAGVRRRPRFRARRRARLPRRVHAAGAGALRGVHHRGDPQVLRQDLRPQPQEGQGAHQVPGAVPGPAGGGQVRGGGGGGAGLSPPVTSDLLHTTCVRT